jgi:uncharacterized protein with GYD domain
MKQHRGPESSNFRPLGRQIDGRFPVPQYLIVGQHPPDLCPSANETVRKLSQEGAGQIPELAKKWGVTLSATYVPMNNHMVFVAVEADDMNSVREFAFQSRLAQWNTIEIYQVSTLEEALTKVNELPTIY